MAIVAVVVVLLLVAAAVFVLTRAKSIDNNVQRVPAFDGTGHSATKGFDGAQNILLIGSDTRNNSLPSAETAAKVAKGGGERSDVLILAHFDKKHEKAQLISIPRDSYVDIPAGGRWKGGKNKINAAYAYGGAPLAVRTVEQLTGDHIDHVALINFAGFRYMTNALNGVDVNVDRTVYDPRSKRTFKAGKNHLTGLAALDYVRQRYNLPGSDFDREKRQQQFLHALLAKATSSGTLTNPVRLNNFLEAASKSMLVDEGFSPTGAVNAFKGIRNSDLTFITTPHQAQGQNVPGAGNVVVLDQQPADDLFTAVKSDDVAAWLAKNPEYKSNPTGGA